MISGLIECRIVMALVLLMFAYSKLLTCAGHHVLVINIISLGRWTVIWFDGLYALHSATRHIIVPLSVSRVCHITHDSRADVS